MATAYWILLTTYFLLTLPTPPIHPILLHHPIGGQGEGGLFGAVEGDDLAGAAHRRGAVGGAGHALDARVADALEGAQFALQDVLHLRAQPGADGVRVAADLGRQVGFDGTGGGVGRVWGVYVRLASCKANKDKNS